MTAQIIILFVFEYKNSPFEFSDINYIKSSDFLSIWKTEALDLSLCKIGYICLTVNMPFSITSNTIICPLSWNFYL